MGISFEQLNGPHSQWRALLFNWLANEKDFQFKWKWKWKCFYRKTKIIFLNSMFFSLYPLIWFRFVLVRLLLHSLISMPNKKHLKTNIKWRLNKDPFTRQRQSKTRNIPFLGKVGGVCVCVCMKIITDRIGFFGSGNGFIFLLEEIWSCYFYWFNIYLIASWMLCWWIQLRIRTKYHRLFFGILFHAANPLRRFVFCLLEHQK